MGGWVDLGVIRYITLLLFIGLAWGKTNKPLSVNNLSWLTGTWQGPIDGNLLEETWLSPRAGTIVALVRSTNELGTQFVEIIHIEEVNGTLELQLQLFDNSLSPASSKAHSFELTKIDERYVSFKGIRSGAPRPLVMNARKEMCFIFAFNHKKVTQFKFD